MEGLSLDKQVELMSEVVHNHSNQIDEINEKCARAFNMVEEDMYYLKTCSDKQLSEVNDLSSTVGACVVWGFLGAIGAGIAGYFGYKKLKEHGERLEKLEKYSRTSNFKGPKDADETVENPKMASN